jgi:oleate hydratase
MLMDGTHTQDKRSPNETHAWILGSGTASLASAVYLIQRGKLPPQNVHILDSHISMGAALHDMGDSGQGYDQFAGCLPVPIGTPLNELLASIPSGRTQDPTVLEEIRKAEASHMPANGHDRTKFIVQKGRSKENLQVGKLGLSVKNRVDLALLMLRSEKRLGRNQIKDFMSKTFFQSIFWITWAAQ